MSSLVTFLSSLHTGALGLMAQSEPRAANIFFKQEGSTIARQIDDVFYFILWVSIISFVLCIGAGAWFVIKYRARQGHTAVHTASHDTRLEVTWTVIPTILVAIMFYVGFESFLDLREAPADSYEVQVVARQWSWEFNYPNGATDSDLHVPVGTPVKLTMTSMDVLHSLYIPAFRVKQDCVPGRYTTLWFEALEPGEYHLFCTEYCGAEHWNMNRTVYVYEQDEYAEVMAEKANWLGDTAILPKEKGERLYNQACASCHLVTDETKIGPGFQIVSEAIRDGSQILFDNAPPLVPDDNYLRESILVPGAKVRSGWPNQMNSFQGQLDETRIRYLITFIKSIAQPEIGAELETPAEGDAGGDEQTEQSE